MAYIVRIRKGRFDYLYECRSRRVEGKVNPVSDRIFIGRVDVETRTFHPKKYEVKGELSIETMETRGRRDLPRIPSCYLPMRDVLTSSKDRA